MVDYEVISRIAKEKVVEKLISKTVGRIPYRDDLVNDIYLILLESNKISEMDDKRLIGYIIGIIKHQVNSVTSKYFKNYNEWEINRTTYKEY